MQWGLNILSVLFLFLPPIENINLKLEGSIDLGPNWNFKYNLVPLRDHYESTETTLRHPPAPKTTSPAPKITTTVVSNTSSPNVTTSTIKNSTTDRGFSSKIANVSAKISKATKVIRITLPPRPTKKKKGHKTTRKKKFKYTRMPEEDDNRKVTIGEEPRNEDLHEEYDNRKETVGEDPSNENLYTKDLKIEVTESDIDTPNILRDNNVKFKTEKVTKTTQTTKTPSKPTTKAVTKTISIPTTVAALRKETNQDNEWTKNNSHIYSKLHKVKDDDRIKEFTVHVMRQSLTVLDNIKNKIDDEKTKNELQLLSKIYMEKFKEFVRENRNEKVKTRLGTQKVILNIIHTSNWFVQKIYEFIAEKLRQNAGLRNVGIENVIRSEFDKEIKLEYQHACKKFGICRTGDGFQTFFIDILTELLKNNDTRLRIATDALAEEIINTDFGKVVDWELQKKVDKYIFELETMETKLIRPMYAMWRNAIGLRNKPIAVMRGATGILVNKTVAFIDLVDTLDAKIQPNEANVKLWNKIKADLSQWTLESQVDIQKIIEDIIKHIEYEIDQLDVDTAQDVNDKLNIILSRTREIPYEGPSTTSMYED